MAPRVDIPGVVYDKSVANVVNISGGKDSTACALAAIEADVRIEAFVFCDTGNEHEETIYHVERLRDFLSQHSGADFRVLRADFADRIAAKREYVRVHWPQKGVPDAIIESALAALHPTGNPFLDLCIWKGMFPSHRRQFCTQELKVEPSETFKRALLASFDAAVSWVGVRRIESARRANAEALGVEFGQWIPSPRGSLTLRPILEWTASDVFDLIGRHDAPVHPFYLRGFARIGCFPCVNSRKDELARVARFDPAHIERIEQWEAAVSAASKGGRSNFFHVRTLPDGKERWDAGERTGIRDVVEWAKTSRGGRQFTLDLDSSETCSSLYGLCE